jgi:hypothetical protein
MLFSRQKPDVPRKILALFIAAGDCRFTHSVMPDNCDYKGLVTSKTVTQDTLQEESKRA